jgi:hypothetical protein
MEPGTLTEPCNRCSHTDCIMARLTSATGCAVCHDPIGYGEPYYSRVSGAAEWLVHAACVERGECARCRDCTRLLVTEDERTMRVCDSCHAEHLR